mmetsp:Transcript_32396/g.23930  ORF Transcript_32396/g.23930 Transcript_32396/m.23930 type:complete len:87 (-) Transcript_32396:305-565(-)
MNFSGDRLPYLNFALRGFNNTPSPRKESDLSESSEGVSDYEIDSFEIDDLASPVISGGKQDMPRTIVNKHEGNIESGVSLFGSEPE